MQIRRFLCAAALGAMLPATAFAQGTGPDLIGWTMFGINRDSGLMSRYDFADHQLNSIDAVRIDGGGALLGIDAAAYIPGHQNVIALWSDPSDNLTKLVYINCETASAAVVGQDLGPGHATGAVAAGMPVEGNATTFDGLDDFTEMPHLDEYMMDNGTVMFSFKAEDTSGIQGMFSKDSSGYDTGGHLTVYLNGSNLKVRLQSTTESQYIPSSQSIEPGVWYHLAFTFGSDGMKLYLDGTEVAASTYTGGVGSTSGGDGNSEPIVIGASSTGSDDGLSTPLRDFFAGRIGDLAVLDFAMSAGEVAARAAEGKKWAVYAIQNVESEEEDGVDFAIEDDTIVPTEPFAAKITVLGAAISYGGQYDMPVTVKCEIAGEVHTPMGPFDKAVDGNVNDDNNPRHHVFPNIYPAGTPIDVIGRAWKKKKSWYSGNKNWHWQIHRTIDGSNSESPYVIVLRDDDDVPDIEGFLDQGNVVEFIQDYIDSETNTISLDENQVIFLFELGVTNLSSPAADFQDLVVLCTLANDPADFSEEDDDDDQAGPASRLIKVNHITGGFAQLMTLDRVYDGLATTDGTVFYATLDQTLYQIDTDEQTETLIGSTVDSNLFGLEFAGPTLLGFEIAGNNLAAISLETGGSAGSVPDPGMSDLGTIIFMPIDQDPAKQPKGYD